MSGIAGTFRLDGAPVYERRVRAMVDTIAHRGPDGCTAWTRGSVGLGHAAHETTPEAEAETWPLVREGPQTVLVADARIDNRDALRRTLHPPRPAEGIVTDAALIAAAYERWDVDCAAHLIGDFAFALWDERERRLFCVRDALGTRPLFYAHAPGRLFAVGSEIKALLSLPTVSRALNEDHLADYLAEIVSDPHATAYQDIRRLPPGHALTVTPEKRRVWEYWSPDPDREVGLSSDAAYAEAFRMRFDEAVRCRCRSNQPVGTYLSGGLDSSSIAVTARNVVQDQGTDALPTFSTVYDRFPSCDEREYIRAVLDEGGFEPHVFRGDDVARLDALTDLLTVHDEPFFAPNLATQWTELPRVRDAGTAVVLDGHGGDEVVSRSFGRLHDLARAGRWGTLAYEVGRAADRTLGDGAALAWHYGVQPWMAERPWTHRLQGWWAQVRAHLSGAPVSGDEENAEASSLLDPEVRERLGVDARRRRIERARREARRSARSEHYHQLTTPMQGRGLEILDRTARRQGVELRFPFLDRRLVSFCLALPADQKRRHGRGRYVLRRSLRGRLPRAVRRRRHKIDFSAHLASGLLREKMRLNALLLDSQGPAHAYLHEAEFRRLLRILEERREETPGRVLFRIWRGAVFAAWMQRWAAPDASPARPNTNLSGL